MYCSADFGCRKAADRIHVVRHKIIGGDVLGNPLKPEEECQNIEVVVPDAMKDGMVLLK